MSYDKNSLFLGAIIASSDTCLRRSSCSRSSSIGGGGRLVGLERGRAHEFDRRRRRAEIARDRNLLDQVRLFVREVLQLQQRLVDLRALLFMAREAEIDRVSE